MSDGVRASDLSRRELLGALARWSVPTVVTVALGTRPLLAQAPSCPPCTKRSGGKCRSCSVSQTLNCQCEPCLGPPYCTGAPSPSMVGAPGVPGAPGSSPGPTGAAAGRPGIGVPQLGGATDDPRMLGRLPAGGLRGYSGQDPLSAPLYREPFSAQSRYRGLGSAFDDNTSLYGRLRGDTIVRRGP